MAAPSKTKTVAIIGAGYAGLVAAKNMLTVGITPTIFDKSAEIGGMWNPECHPSWKSLKTNLSRFTTCYTDFPWPYDAPMFPTQAEMCQYLKGYAEIFVPTHHFQLETTVTSVARTPEGSDGPARKMWTVQWTNATGIHVGSFDHVIIATGFFSNRHIPPISIERFNGTVIHSEEYRSPDSFQNKRVVVIGSSFSSAEICAELGRHARDVINVVSNPFWAIPRYLPLDPDDPATPFVPVDMLFYRRTGRKSFMEIVIKSAADYQASNQYFGKVCGRGHRHEFEPTEDGGALPFVAISDNYLPCVRSGLITTQSGRIQGASGTVVTLEDGTTIEDVDAIIFCTGFRPKFEFLSPEILNAVSFDPNDSFCPLLLHKAAFCPELPGLAFVGVYRGPYFLIAELQAMWAARLFSRELIPIMEQQEGILVEQVIRNQVPRPQFPHPDYVGLASSLAEKIGIFQTEAIIKERPLFMPADFRPGPGAMEMRDAALTRLNTEYRKYLAGKMVAGAVFRALAGSWTITQEHFGGLDPEIDTQNVRFGFGTNENDTHHFLQSATTGPGSDSQIFCGNSRHSLLPEWSWRYDARNDQLSIKVNRDGDGPESDYIPLQILPPEAAAESAMAMEWKDEMSQFPGHSLNAKGWRAITKSSNSEIQTLKFLFLFQFTGILLSSVQILARFEAGTTGTDPGKKLLITLSPQKHNITFN